MRKCVWAPGTFMMGFYDGLHFQWQLEGTAAKNCFQTKKNKTKKSQSSLNFLKPGSRFQHVLDAGILRKRPISTGKNVQYLWIFRFCHFVVWVGFKNNSWRTLPFWWPSTDIKSVHKSKWILQSAKRYHCQGKHKARIKTPFLSTALTQACHC